MVPRPSTGLSASWTRSKLKARSAYTNDCTLPVHGEPAEPKVPRDVPVDQFATEPGHHLGQGVERATSHVGVGLGEAAAVDGPIVLEARAELEPLRQAVRGGEAGDDIELARG
jgi:hypothetical protein